MTVVDTPRGRLRGIASGGVVAFRGVPYAQAERFGAPEPVSPWSWVRHAFEPGPESPQVEGMLSKYLGLFGATLPQSDDCLSLNVVTPGCDGARRPVVVWIHGGAFTSGGGANPWYDGAALARRHGLVVVTINYRLGIFGFPGRANLGTLDQLEALRWVRDSIAGFGGDPANVTLAGASAGGTSILALLGTGDGPDLFHCALLASASVGQIRTPERADQALAQYLDAAGAHDLDGLRHLPVEDLLAAQAAVLALPGGGFSGFSPCEDGVTITGVHRATASWAGPMVLGTTRDEMQLFADAGGPVDDGALRERFREQFGDLADEAIDRYRAHRPDADNAHLVAAVETDRVLRVPARRIADARSAEGTPTWSYWFTWPSSAFGGRLGACHGLDVPFLFDDLDAPGVDRFTGPDPSREVASALGGALAALAHGGDPGWARYDSAARTTRRFDTTIEDLHDVEPGLRELWEAAADR